MAKILTVDDSVSMRALIAQTLREAGHEVHEACDGVDALKKASGQKLDLLISDVNMPNMDGLTLIKTLRQEPAHKFTPILVLTTEVDPEKKKVAKEAGATGWIVKPFNPDQLLATIKKVLG